MKEEKEIKKDSDLLISSLIPPERIASTFLIFFGLVISVLPQFAENRDEVGTLPLACMLVGGIVLVGAGIALANASKRLDVFFRRSDCSLLLLRKGWFSSKLESEVIQSKEISGIELETSRDSDGDDLYQIVIRTLSGQKIPVSQTSYSREALLEKKCAVQDTIMNGSAGVRLAQIGEQSRAQLKLPKPVLLTIGLVVITPFACDLLGQQAHFSRIEFLSGIPDAQTCARIQALAGSALQSTEQILWVGQPEPGREASLKMWMMIPFSIVWTLFSMLWTCLAFYGARSSKNPLGYVMVLFGLPFVLIGLGLLVTPYFSRQHDLNTVYALTDHAAIRIINGKGHRMVDYQDADFGPIELVNYKSDRGDLLFVTDRSEGSKHPYGGFYGVLHPEQALEVLHRYSGQMLAKHRRCR